MKKLAAIFLLLAVLLGGVAIYQHRFAPSAGTPTLTIYCAAGLKKPVDAIAEQYRQETGVEVRLQFGGTGTLLSALRVAKQGDLFIAADEGSVADARKGDTIREVLPLAVQHPVIAVHKGNPKNVLALADLLRDDVKVALANPEAASISRVSRKALGETWEKLAAHATVMKPTVTEIAADVSLGTVDAGIIWDATAAQFKETQAIDVPELEKSKENASACVLSFSTQPTAALRFARYLTAPEKGGAIFKENGFTPAGGDKWVDVPELILYSGGVNRPAIEGLLGQFRDREGIKLTTVFNGCGILCASMKTMGGTSNPKFPDAYYACDLCFVPPVADVFPEAVILTETDIGIVVPKGNPHGVKTLADLAQPNLKVGLCNAEQATLGYMTRGMLKSSGLQESVHKNVVVETPTADLLVNQMRVGALDAAIVYRVNFQPSAEFLDYLPIQHEGAHAVQPFAVRADSPNARLGQRLLAFLKSNRAQFEQAGFQWRGEETAVQSKDIVIPDWLKNK
ncbi:MAG: substrate-binding domain-containing protein [Chthoniobacter sp.]|uniref:substrate-binding domain-containing protein n=1 Tax=Chthoniobacter sp. TaxID=2510640 RepID=UPI0032A62C2E